jgi:hypothetical protein
MFRSDTFSHIIQSLSLSKGKMLSGFAIGHPGQRRVPLLVENIIKSLLNQRHVSASLLKTFSGCNFKRRFDMSMS